ncbi:hypothetical protein A6K24_12650 [Metabacillus litoralis]|uniref:Uncharacterized protein n=1 Tax=Metabacillus litoralis TaxID=152268 RepID=A0A179SMA0_9BACI|nr:hypothetical protein A6K24_12650 [Metabacillus litoralis]
MDEIAYNSYNQSTQTPCLDQQGVFSCLLIPLKTLSSLFFAGEYKVGLKSKGDKIYEWKI